MLGSVIMFMIEAKDLRPKRSHRPTLSSKKPSGYC